MKKQEHKSNRIVLFSILILALVLSILVVGLRGSTFVNQLLGNSSKQELKEITDSDYDTQSDNVKFTAYFLSNDKKMDGTYNRIGYNDTLYFDLSVQEGTLENAKINIDSQNFYLETNLMSDSVISQNYVSNNTKEIDLNTITGPIQRTFEGSVKSGDYEFTTTKAEAIGEDISNYNKVNTITFTADYTDSTGKKTNISKEVNLSIGWYGEINCEIPQEVYGNDNLIQKYNISNYLDSANGKMTVEFNVATQETNNEVLIKKSYIEGTIPSVNNYEPTEVVVEGENVQFTYDPQTKKFTASREASVSDNAITEEAYSGTYAQNEINYRYNEYKVEVTYPIDAYLSDDDGYINMDIPVTGHYEGFNGERSNDTTATINVSYSNLLNQETGFSATVGRSVLYPEARQVVSKENVLLGYEYRSVDDIESTYYTKWNIVTTQGENASSVVLTDNSVEDKFVRTDGTTVENNGYITNKGIAFSNPVSALGEDGWIKVYNAETGKLLHEFTSADWANYDTLNPYEYGEDVKYIKIETSDIAENSFVIVYNIKSFNISKIKQDFTEEEVNNLEYIESSFNGSMNIAGKNVTYNSTPRANFEEEISALNFHVSDGEINTQGSNNLSIEIDPNTTQYNSSRWSNEEFLLKFPSDIINVTINNIRTDVSNKTIKNYYQYNENGNIFVKIKMGGDSINDYELLLDCTVETNPNATSKTSDIELYAYNEENNKFYKNDMSQDIYDVNNNSNTDELVGKKKDSINIVSPETLLTNESTSNATNDGETIYAPLTAIVENNERKATVDIELINNHSNPVTDVKVLGRLPFKENKYQLTGEDLGSTYTSELTSDGIVLPEELARYATIYYSEHEEVNDDTTDASNGWTQNVSDYSKVRNFLVVFNRYEIQPTEEIKISYTITIPGNIQYNEIAYSTHAVYYSEHNGSEITRKTTEVNKLGFMIAKRVDFEISNYSLEGNTGIEGVKFLLTETGDREQSSTLTSNAEGKVDFTNLLLERTYKLEEIGVPDEYILNNKEFTFRAYEENGEIKLDLTGDFDEGPTINQAEKKIYTSLTNEVKYDVNIKNLSDSGSGVVSTFKLEGRGQTVEEQTDEQGNLVLEGLYPEEEYTLTQTYSKGYYLDDNNKITFKITRGENGLQIESDKAGELSLTKEAGKVKPVLNYSVTNETIPKYNLTVTLYERDTNIALESADYKITGGGKESGETYTTDSKGQFTISDLYAYVDGKNETAEYVLKQTKPTTGYTLSGNDIKFVVSRNPDTQELTLTVNEGEIRADYTIQGNNLSIGLDAKKIFNITTVDGETVNLLPGVKLAISELSIIDNQEVETEPMDEAGNVLGQEEIINGKPCRVFTTNEDGIIDEPLRDGIYKIVKVAVPDGYVLEENEEDRTYYVGIGETRGASVDISFRDPTYVNGTSSTTNPSDYYVSGRDDGVGLFYHRGQLTLMDDESQVIKSISSNAVSQIIDDNGTFVVLEDSRIVKYNDNLDVIESYNLPNGMDTFAATSDGGYIVAGTFSGTKTVNNTYTASGSRLSITSKGGTDIFVMKVNSTGKVENIADVGGTGADVVTFITVTTDGDYVVSSHMTSSSISGTIMSDGKQETGNFADCYFVMDKDTMKVNQIVSVGTSRGNVSADQGNAHRAFAGNDGGIYYVGQMSGTIKFTASQTESGSPITVTSTGSTDAYLAKFNSEGKVVWAIAVGGKNTDHIYSAEYTPDGELLIGGDSNGGAITVSGSHTSSGLDIVSEPVGDNASTWRGIAIKVDAQGRVVWTNEFGYSANEGIYAFAGFTGNSYVICGFDTINGVRTDAYIRVDEAETRSEISEVEGIEIQNIKKRYNITTSVNGEGGTITGQDQDKVEEVVHGENATVPITVKANDGYEILAIEVNGEMIPFTPDENNSVTLPLFENITEDLNVVAYFSNNTSRIVVHHYLDGTDTRIAEDETYVGTVGTEYRTGPKIGLVGYELAKNEDGSFKVDGETSGTYDEFDKEITYYYVATPVRVIVNHFVEGTNVSLSGTKEYEYEKGQTYTTNVADDIPEEYELVKVPSNATGIIEEPEIVVTYYYRLKPQYNYKIEYYYDGVLDTSATETLQSIEGKQIDTYPDKPKEGYVFDRTENLPLTVSTDEIQNVIKVYYKPREDLSYKVEYYYDGQINQEKTDEFSNVKFGTTITKYEDKVIEGYQLERVENTPLTVGVNTDQNVIKVYYTIRKDLYYTVNYYEQGTNEKIADSKEVAGNTYHSVIIESPIDIPGYNKVSNDPQSITIEVDEAQNAINFYYTKRTDLTYTVNYYEQGTQDKVAESKVVENQTFKDSITENAIEIAGYNKVEPATQTIEIGVDNNEINFYYQKRTDIKYSVEYYFDNVLDPSLTENYMGTFKDVISTYTDKVKNAYELDRTENLPLTISANEDTNVIRVYYVRVNATITENKIQKTATDIITAVNQKVDYTLTYTGKLENYIGNAQVTIVDTLPCAIDEANSDIAGGKYDANSNTITWTDNVESIDTYTDESTGNINITKQISVTYVNMDYTNAEIINKANAKISLDTTGQEENASETDASTQIGAMISTDLTVSGQREDGYVKAGDVLTYTITINNAGGTAKDVIVANPIPEGTTFVPNSIKLNGKEALNTQDELINGITVNVERGSSATLSFQVTVNDIDNGDIITNKATVDGKDTNEVAVNYIEAVITERKTASTEFGKDYVLRGEKITYTVTVANGGDLAKDVVIKDSIPEGATFVENSIKVNDTEMAKTAEDLANGITVNVPEKGQATLSFEVIVSDSATQVANIAYVDDEPTNEVKYSVLTYEKSSQVVRQTDQELETGELTAGDKIIYTINVNNLGEAPANGIIVKDTIPDGTTVSQVNNNGVVNDKDEISWNIANIPGNSTGTVSFEVTVNYDMQEAKEIRNKAMVDEKETNEVINTYEKPEAKIESNITKEGTNTITATEDNVDYTITYNATVDDFVGDGQITIVDYLPYAIDLNNSNIAGGTYDADSKTITWVEPISVMDTYANDAKTINIVKDISLKYLYDDEEHLSGNIENRVTGKIELTQNSTVVKTEEKEATHQAMAQIPTKVIVHHYIEGTTDKVPSIDDGKVVEDVVIDGYIGSEYATNKADNVDKAYEFASSTANTTGTMTKQTIEVTYYYKLKEATINANITKTSDTKEVTDLNEKIPYTVEYSSTIKDYRGDATLTIVDTLPYEIDEANSQLADGVYDAKAKTITWTEQITGIDTYLNGDRPINRTKQINLVYAGIDLNEDAIENTVNAKLTLTTGKENTVQANASIPVNFRVDKTIEKVWDDNEDTKGRRPNSVTVYLTADGARVAERSAILSTSNEWKVTFSNLPKYTDDRKEINYSAEETETNAGDLEYYEKPVIEKLDNVIRITNSYKLMESDLNSSIDITGTNSISSSKSKVSYNIKYNATVEGYIGEALVTVVAHLPYAIDVNSSDIAGGTYDSKANTITWTQKIDHIDTYLDGNYVVSIEKQIQLVFSDLDATQNDMTIEAEGKIDLYETEVTNTVKDTHVTSISIPGKVVVKYIDKRTGNELADGYEINGKVGEDYNAVQKDIYGCRYIENSGNTTGKITEDTIYVTYYYERIESAPITVKYIDEDSGEEIATRETITGYIGDKYETVQKDIENYDFVRAEGETSGELTSDKKEVVYVYKKIPARVIVRYLEKDDTETDNDNTELAKETIIEGFSGDKYTTERKDIEGYVPADPEPANAEGTMGRGDMYVIYYYERQQSGVVRAKYVDVDTGKEILYVDSSTGEVKTYREEQKAYVGDDYSTTAKEIPYYTFVEDRAPENGEGKFTTEDIDVIYYYKKQSFNMSVQTELTNIKLNGIDKHVSDEGNKVEIYRKSTEDAQLEVTFKVLVSNTGDIEGTTTVVDTLPQYFEIAEGTSSEWKQTKDGQLKARVDLAPGETKELIIVLKWIPGQSHFGDLINTAELEDVVNPANFTETTEEDNKSTAELVVSILTGENRSLTSILIELIILLAVAGKIIVQEKKIKHNK